ncbi:ABC transporter ATP-binding protein [Abyssalbus ytuae]|uniref:ABC transporter ATP-binding protein n=1 Tax=Abyssalbus ytuae TaxID=2926907 RepID=A0A9E6ZL72_9FLAO|nr:ABC transporter ATP-binding protein [Abyssalbus ytuae]UOB16639.1 ABC transporter ATP-binding protein [Abyssalbus ytuae]
MNTVIVENLSKKYDEKIVVNNVSFKVNEGELFGLIGPDGAGKTSIFRMLTTLLLPDSGMAEVCGHNVVSNYKEIRKRIGYMPGKFSLYQDLSVEENLNFFATIFNTTVEANYSLIKDIYVQLEPFKKRKSGKLSGGMKQKLALCCALIHRPEVLFLDEPTTGVDTVSRKEFWAMLKKLKNEGITILVSTPYMDEATLCERIGLIQDGKILSIDTPQTIIKKYPGSLYAIKSDNMIQLLSDLRKLSIIESVHSFGEDHHVTFKNHHTDFLEIENKLKSHLSYPFKIQSIKPTVEDCFIKLMTN